MLTVAPGLWWGEVSGPPRPRVWDPRLLWATFALIAVLLIGAIIISLVDRWRKRPAQDRFSPSDQLTQFRTLYEEGELSPEEFSRIKGRLTGRMMQEMELPPPPGESPPLQPPAAEPPPPEC